MMRKVKNMVFIGFLVFLFAGSLLFPCPAFSFSVPERLQYDLTWTGIKTGEASLETKESGNFVQFISKASSAKWLSFLFSVDDHVISTVKKVPSGTSPSVGTPHTYKIRLKEGKYRNDKEYVFDFKEKKLRYINHRNSERRQFPLQSMPLDPLSSFYFMRMLPLKVGKPIFIEIFDDKKFYNLEVQVLRKEIIELPAGTFNTIVIKPLMKTEGIFRRRGDLFIWLTDDEKKIPVQLKTKVSVGSVKAVLVGGNY